MEFFWSCVISWVLRWPLLLLLLLLQLMPLLQVLMLLLQLLWRRRQLVLDSPMGPQVAPISPQKSSTGQLDIVVSSMSHAGDGARVVPHFCDRILDQDGLPDAQCWVGACCCVVAHFRLACQFHGLGVTGIRRLLPLLCESRVVCRYCRSQGVPI